MLDRVQGQVGVMRRAAGGGVLRIPAKGEIAARDQVHALEHAETQDLGVVELDLAILVSFSDELGEGYVGIGDEVLFA